MHYLFIQRLFADDVIQALCWTFIHSLWQGLIFAIIAGVLLAITRKADARLRYNLMVGILFLFLLVTGFTLGKQLNNTIVATLQGPMSGQTFISQFVTYCNLHAPVIVGIWFIIFSAKCVNILGGLVRIQRIRNYNTQSPAKEWQEQVVVLARKLQIHKTILLLESALVKVPMVIGALKPVIIMPVGLLANLPADQACAILLHELAHIRRKDYLVNLMQSFVEILFFFNPAVLWLSSLIKEEREHCCDDLAVAGIKSKKKYVQALVAFQEYNLDLTNGSPVVAFTGEKNHLLNRVKRIVHKDNTGMRPMDRIVLVLSLFILVLIGFAPIRKIHAQSTTNTNLSQTMDNDQLNPEKRNHELLLRDEALKIRDKDLAARDEKLLSQPISEEDRNRILQDQKMREADLQRRMQEPHHTPGENAKQ